MVDINPNELYLKLHENASVRKKRTLELIHETCKMQSRSNIKDFSLRNIANLLQEKGGPSEQAMRNKTPSASDYRALISNWAAYSNTSIKKPKRQKSTSLNDEILANITDPTAHALVGMLIAENKKLKNENSLLKHQTTFTIDMRNPKDEYINIRENSVLTSHSYNLLEIEIKALKEAISDDFMNHRGWTIDENGRIKEKGSLVYRLGYVSAIKKVISN